jgi:hypothetical protein
MEPMHYIPRTFDSGDLVSAPPAVTMWPGGTNERMVFPSEAH